ncbi:hypothetical protein PybrP1_002763 [[Pythium] brassicae (nom. inval.)]|nr:hypothetical protein PybrP1_002763 [[Pythium] brassicae (nom. inval.)]
MHQLRDFSFDHFDNNEDDGTVGSGHYHSRSEAHQQIVYRDAAATPINSTPTATASGNAQAESSSAADKTGKKRARYLRDTDRRSIIQRIDSGEKQAVLAREFGVTRAAVCHIKKNREEIISRYDQLMQSAREMEGAGMLPESQSRESRALSASTTGASVVVLEVHSRAVPILVTTLRDVNTRPVDFRRAACRLIVILIEEAIAGLGTQTVKTEPDVARGYVHVALDVRHRQCKVLLFCATVGDSDRMAVTVELLLSYRVPASRICVVAILLVAEAVDKLCIKIVAAAVDPVFDHSTGAILPGLGDFTARYNSGKGD